MTRCHTGSAAVLMPSHVTKPLLNRHRFVDNPGHVHRSRLRPSSRHQARRVSPICAARCTHLALDAELVATPGPAVRRRRSARSYRKSISQPSVHSTRHPVPPYRGSNRVCGLRPPCFAVLGERAQPHISRRIVEESRDGGPVTAVYVGYHPIFYIASIQI